MIGLNVVIMESEQQFSPECKSSTLHIFPSFFLSIQFPQFKEESKKIQNITQYLIINCFEIQSFHFTLISYEMTKSKAMQRK